MNILQALDHKHLFRSAIRDPGTFVAWRALLTCAFGLPMTEEQVEIFHTATGRQTPPTTPFREMALVCGRRSGKSFMMALIAVFLACFRDYLPFLTAGERATVMVIAADRKQARVIMRYVRGLLDIPMLKVRVENETAESFELSGRVTIEVGTASHRSVRGYTIAAILCDEIAFWSTSEESASPDTEIMAALRPAMATIPTAMMIIASSPYGRKGVLWSTYRQHFGVDDAPVLVWKAPTRTMNPTVPQSVIDEAMERDPAAANAEFMAEFRVDLESFVSRETIDACVVPGRLELPRLPDAKYVAFTDASGGSIDSFTLAIGHADKDVAVLDLVRERKPPFSPDAVVQEYSAILKSYGIAKVSGDRYSGEFVRELFRKNGIDYHPSVRTASENYVELLPLLNASRAELLDSPRLINQLANLERRTSRTGKDTISHPPGSHDDVICSVAGALTLTITPKQHIPIVAPYVVSAPRNFGASYSDPLGRTTSQNPALSNWSR